MSWRHATNNRATNFRYRIAPTAKPYGGRILWPETITEAGVYGRIKGVTATRFYRAEELQEIVDWN